MLAKYDIRFRRTQILLKFASSDNDHVTNILLTNIMYCLSLKVASQYNVLKSLDTQMNIVTLTHFDFELDL